MKKPGEDAMEVDTKETSVEESPYFKSYFKLVSALDVLIRAVIEKDTRALYERVLREASSAQKSANALVLIKFIETHLAHNSETRILLIEKLSDVSESMDIDIESDGLVKENVKSRKTTYPEVEAFCLLLSQKYFIAMKYYEKAKEVSDFAVNLLGKYNRRTLDVLSSRIYANFSLSYEHLNKLKEIRSLLLNRLQTAVLQHDSLCQETLLNLLLRNYLHYNLYDQAEKLRSKSIEPSVSNAQVSRYLYYWGRIRTIQLEYTDARDCLQQAIRKAPNSAYGFHLTCSKWLILVNLLLGDIPPMIDFMQESTKNELKPYFQLTSAVRTGDLITFKKTSEEYCEAFRKDKMQNLIVRLRHNVLRTGLRRINTAYSRISLSDVAKKLGLGSDDDVERIVAKAIRDGGIDAIIDHKEKSLKSIEIADVYSTQEPQKAFHARIAFCLDIHNEAIKAMRFDPDANKTSLEDAEARKERVAQEQELAKAIQEEEEEEDY